MRGRGFAYDADLDGLSLSLIAALSIANANAAYAAFVYLYYSLKPSLWLPPWKPRDTRFGSVVSHGSDWHHRDYRRRCTRSPEVVDCRSGNRFGDAIARWAA